MFAGLSRTGVIGAPVILCMKTKIRRLIRDETCPFMSALWHTAG
jgi:hypothetical protein